MIFLLTVVVGKSKIKITSFLSVVIILMILSIQTKSDENVTIESVKNNISSDNFVDIWLNQAKQCVKEIYSVKATFVHETIHKSGKQLAKKNGIIFLKKGGLFRLEYKNNNKQVIVSNGKIIRSWNPQTKTLIESNAKKELLFQAFGFILNDKTKEFNTRFVGGSKYPVKNGGMAVIELIPVKKYSLVKKILLTFEPACPMLKRIVIIDKTGSAVRITLDKIKTNVQIEASKFMFTPPAGGKVIYL